MVVRRSPSAAELIARRRTLPSMDPDELKRDLDDVLEPTLWAITSLDVVAVQHPDEN